MNYEGPLAMVRCNDTLNPFVQKQDSIIFDFTKSNAICIGDFQQEKQTDIDNLLFYYVDEMGTRTPIPISFSNGNLDKSVLTDDDSSKVFLFIRYSKDSRDYSSDIISSSKNLLRSLKEQQDLMDSITKGMNFHSH